MFKFTSNGPDHTPVARIRPSGIHRLAGGNPSGVGHKACRWRTGRLPWGNRGDRGRRSRGAAGNHQGAGVVETCNHGHDHRNNREAGGAGRGFSRGSHLDSHRGEGYTHEEAHDDHGLLGGAYKAAFLENGTELALGEGGLAGSTHSWG